MSGSVDSGRCEGEALETAVVADLKKAGMGELGRLAVAITIRRHTGRVPGAQVTPPPSPVPASPDLATRLRALLATIDEETSNRDGEHLLPVDTGCIVCTVGTADSGKLCALHAAESALRRHDRASAPATPTAGLLECPFCGSTEVALAGERDMYFFSCGRCRSTGPMGVLSLEAHLAWNGRIPTAASRQTGEVDGLVASVENYVLRNCDGGSYPDNLHTALAGIRAYFATRADVTARKGT